MYITLVAKFKKSNRQTFLDSTIYTDNADTVARIRHKHTLKAKYRSYQKVPRHIAQRKIIVDISMKLTNCFNIKLDFHRCINFIF